MTDLLYDGSFDGFLCALARCLRDSSPPRIVSIEERTPELFTREEPLPTDPVAADAFRRRFLGAAGPDELETLLLVHASADPLRHELLQDYALLALRYGPRVAQMMGHPVVCAAQKARCRVTWEIGKLTGFLRFRRAGNRFWYAPVQPQANVVGFMGPHFSDRFPDERFLIHDTGRGLGYYGAPGAGGLVDLCSLPQALREALARNEEPEIAAQWQAYFRAIAIPERRNPRLRDRNMPRRFWKHLVEEPR